MPTAVAPNAIAFTTSVPDRIPLSNSTGVDPAPATTSGSMSIAAMPPFACRPPWFEQ